MKKKIILGLLIILGIFVIIGCGNESKEKLHPNQTGYDEEKLYLVLVNIGSHSEVLDK